MQPFSSQEQMELNDRMAMTANTVQQRGPASTSREFSARGALQPMYGSNYAQDPTLGNNPEALWNTMPQMPPQYQQQVPLDAALSGQDNGQPEDFILMDVVGGGCASQLDSTGQLSVASRSISVLHPSKPVVAYSAGCMIIVYDLLSDSKVNLMGHKHNVYALAFTPNGQNLMSVDFNRDVELHNAQMADGEVPQSSSSITLWDWQRGVKIQTANIPRTSSLTEALIANQSAAIMYGQSMGQASHVQEFTMNSAKSTQSCYIQISFEKSGALFTILESSPLDIGGGYRVTLWSFNKSQYMEVISSMDLELQNPCVDIGVIPRSQNDVLNAQRTAGSTGHSTQVFLHSKLSFFTAEKQCIKLWEYSQGNAQLQKRIHIKQAICSVVQSELTNFLLILGESGKLLILDSQGEFVSTLTKDGVVFTRIGTAHDKLLLGTNRGTVHVYHMASLQFISEIPYQLSFIEKFSLNSFNKSMAEIEQLSLSKVGPPVTEIGTTLNLRYLWIRYSDGSFAMIDRTIMNPKQAVLGYSCGHFEYVSDMQWIAPKSSLDMVSRAGGFMNLPNSLSPFGQDFQMDGLINQGVSNSAGTHDLQFVTSSHDLSIHLWRHYGDRWAFSYIDIAKSFDQSLLFQRKQCDRSTREMKLTAICVYPRSNNIIVGDNKGYIRVFQLVNENAHLISTHKLHRTSDIKTLNGLGITPPQGAQLTQIPGQSVQVDTIKQIYISNNEQVAVVTFESGNVSVYDTKNGFNLIGDAVESDFQKFNTQYSPQDSLCLQTKVIECNLAQNQGGIGNSLKERLNLYKKYRPSVPQQDEQPQMATTQSQNGDFDTARMSYANVMQNSNIMGAHGTSLKVLSLASPNQVSLLLVDIKGSRLARSKLNQFVISEGKVTGFDVHPSNDYLLVTSSKGRIYVFRIDTGELRGTIKIPLNSSDCLVDPSGLYVLIKVPAFAQQNTYNLMLDGGQAEQERVGHFAVNQKEFERNTLLMYEIGTGQPAAEIASVFEITCMQFSSDGQYLSMGSTNGGVCVWSMGNHLHQNVKQVIDAMKLQSDFWFNYPIFLPDYEQFNNNLGQPPQDDANLFVQPPQDIAQAIFPPQERAFNDQVNRSMDQPPISEAAQSVKQAPTTGNAPGVNPAPYQLNSQQDWLLPQRPKQFEENKAPVQQPAQQYQLPPQYAAQAPQVAPQPPAQTSEQYQVNNPYGAANFYPTQQQVRQTQVMGPAVQQFQNMPLTASNNEQRFLRKSSMQNQASNRQWRQAQIPNTQRANQQVPFGASQLPPNYPQINQQQAAPAWSQAPQAQAAAPIQYPSTNFYGYLDPPKEQPVPQAAGQIPRPLTQQSASEILLGKQQTETLQYAPKNEVRESNVANEPQPANMSQHLYQQPLQATIKGQETMEKSKAYEQYADLANKTIATQGVSGERAYVLRPPNLEKVEKTNFDKSLNDREAILAASFTQEKPGLSFGASRNMKLQSQIQNVAPMMPPLAQQLNEQSAMNSVRPAIDQPLIPPRTTDLHQNRVTAFSNTLTQQDILQQNSNVAIKGSIQPDPEGIDGGDVGTGLTTKIAIPAQKSTNELNKEDELDALNKYLGGVKVPQAIKGQIGQKSELARANDQGSRIYQLYKSSYTVPSSSLPIGNQLAKRQMPASNTNSEAGRESFVKQTSNYDVVDEVYQNIDDFEAKLGQLRGQAS